jgi:hypothetical protein
LDGGLLDVGTGLVGGVVEGGGVAAGAEGAWRSFTMAGFCIKLRAEREPPPVKEPVAVEASGCAAEAVGVRAVPLVTGAVASAALPIDVVPDRAGVMLCVPGMDWEGNGVLVGGGARTAGDESTEAEEEFVLVWAGTVAGAPLSCPGRLINFRWLAGGAIGRAAEEERDGRRNPLVGD